MKKENKENPPFEIQIGIKLLNFLANEYPNEKHCSLFEPDSCDACHKKLDVIKFVLKQLD